MRLTPLEVDRRQFQRVFRGCDPEEVHAFLDLVSREIEELGRENQQVREELRRRDALVAEYREHEARLRDALVSASRVTEEMRDAARRDADLVRAEAELAARRIVAQAEERVVRLSDEVQALRLQRARLLAELTGIIDGHRRILRAHEETEVPDR